MSIVPKGAERNFYEDSCERLDNLSFTSMNIFLNNLQKMAEKVDLLKEDEETVWNADILSNLSGLSSNISQLHSKISLLISQKEVRESQKNLHNAMQCANMTDEEKQTLEDILGKHGYLPKEYEE